MYALTTPEEEAELLCFETLQRKLYTSIFLNKPDSTSAFYICFSPPTVPLLISRFIFLHRILRFYFTKNKSFSKFIFILKKYVDKTENTV